MDVELENIVDEIIDINHEISWWIRELLLKEIHRSEITREQVLENEFIEKLYEKKINKCEEFENKFLKKIREDEEQGDKSDKIELFIEYYKDYLMESYESLELLNTSKALENDELADITIEELLNNGFNESIYSGRHEELIILREWDVTAEYFDSLQFRMESELKGNAFSGKEKRLILNKVAKDNYYNNFLFDYYDEIIEDTQKRKDNARSANSKKKYETLRVEYIKQKYADFYTYLEEKHLGYIRENDYGKFEKARKAIKGGLLSPVLKLSKFEIDSIVEREESDLEEIKMVDLENVEYDILQRFKLQKNENKKTGAKNKSNDLTKRKTIIKNKTNKENEQLINSVESKNQVTKQNDAKTKNKNKHKDGPEMDER